MRLESNSTSMLEGTVEIDMAWTLGLIGEKETRALGSRGPRRA